ncbi:MAG: asparagine--tRNA ligase [Candidatus Micrarchaeota archaeon]|nr:asparagine--tRNA ligase [Candidatus Micrarchaeota archaeon]
MLKMYQKSSTIGDAKRSIGRQITIKGWIYRKRSSGGKIFAVIHDHTGTMQCVIDRKSLNEKDWECIDKAYLESSIILRGKLKKDERAPGGVELEASELHVLHSGDQFPITEYQSPELLLDFRHLWLRSQRMRMIMRARSYVFRYLREFLDRRMFYEISPPLLTVSAGETGSNLFEVEYFGKKVYLTESSQLYSEAMVYSLGKVYTLAPSYRAERSRTVKHLAEYWHLEPEMAYYDNAMSMRLQSELVSYVANRLASKNADILEALNVSPETLSRIRPPFRKMTYEQAIAKLGEMGSSKKWGDDFGVEEERLLTMDEEKPIFVYNWPKEIKAFYMPVNDKDPRTVACADMLAPKGHGEIIGGSERIWKEDELVSRMKELNFNLDNYKWYIDLRKYGSVPHSGFGLGAERLIKWMLNLEHIRDAIPFPRMINRMSP